MLGTQLSFMQTHLVHAVNTANSDLKEVNDLDIPYDFEIKTPSNLRSTPLLKGDFQGIFLQGNTFHCP
jgi:hypothetical protein